MERSRIARTHVALALLASTAVAATQAPTRPSALLHEGDPAPPIGGIRWLKGKPVDLDDGKIHVIEFWATWCGPCALAMPQLSHLARRFRGRVEFAGISVCEMPSNKSVNQSARVASFVRHARDMMDYSVGADGPAASMARTWLNPAGQQEIPCAFVVDRAGKIAWIGNPLMGLDQVLPLVVAGRFDGAAEERLRNHVRAMTAEQPGLDAQIQSALARRDYRRVVSLCDRELADMPWTAENSAAVKYEALTHLGPTSANRFANDLVRRQANSPLVLTSVANAIVDEAYDIKEPRDYGLARRLMKRAAGYCAPDYWFSGIYADVLVKSGDPTGAYRWQILAIKDAVASGRFTPKGLDELRQKLREYTALAAANLRR